MYSSALVNVHLSLHIGCIQNCFLGHQQVMNLLSMRMQLVMVYLEPCPFAFVAFAFASASCLCLCGLGFVCLCVCQALLEMAVFQQLA
jgi:hypothetical protein